MSAERSARMPRSFWRRPLGDPVADLRDPARADAAWDGLAARFARAEAGQQASEVHDAGAVVGDHHRTRAEVGPAARRDSKS